jgi:hypothetical protein
MSPKVTALHKPAIALELYVELHNSQPRVHRTLLVPETITLFKLHVILKWAMGWTGGHLHEFIINHRNYGEIDPDYPHDDLLDEQRVRLDRALGSARNFRYIYDYGDAWDHRIKIKNKLLLAEKLKTPMCLDGANACPPEDVGGVYGYRDFLEIINDPNHEEHEALLTWCGGHFDATAFDLTAVNQLLQEIKL